MNPIVKCWLWLRPRDAHTRRVLRYGAPHRHVAHKVAATLVCTVVGAGALGAAALEALVPVPAPSVELTTVARTGPRIDVPEPSSLALFAGGFILLIALRKVGKGKRQ